MSPTTKIAASLIGTAAVIGVAFAAPVLEGGRKFTVMMTGAAEVNASGVPNQGDPDGTGTALLTLNYGQSRVCFEITVSNIATPTAAHIHEAPTTLPGPIVVPLFVGAGSSMTGCVEADREEIKEIIQHPEDYYVNVHNAEYPAGAIRGQLAK
jgi:hypothetical protein